MRAFSLGDFTDAQLRRLMSAIGLGDSADEVCAIVADLIGPAARRPLSAPPLWCSDVADDHTPIEYSIAFDEDGTPTLRLLVECVAQSPGPRTNMLAAVGALDRLAGRLSLTLDKFDVVRDLFLPADPVGHFTMWYSIVVRPGSAPKVKIYFNPEVQGIARASRLVSEGLDRLGFTGSSDWLRAHSPRPGAAMDRYSFFALDLDDSPKSRVKVYVSHLDATIRDAQYAASAGRAVHGMDVIDLADFCDIASGGDDTFGGRPLVSAYTFLSGDSAQPSGYSLYVPIRDYVSDDEAALHRVRRLMDRYGLDASTLERAIGAVTSRPLAAGVGLIAHVSLRIGPPRPGVTVYLSAEAYGVAAPRPARVGAA
ncbi:MAG: tryptophan dimethylallyltransferase [Actinomycetota bacterium]|nr:tryptophan dimethylallyltransferase [Actinomycetota bacterium]